MVLGIWRLLVTSIRDGSHLGWVLSQQAAVRGLAALKFFIAARILGPEQVGLLGIALLSLAVVEALTDTGLAQAVVQQSRTLNAHRSGAIWTLSICRGIAVAGAILGLAYPISLFFRAPAALYLVGACAAIPVLKGLGNPNVLSLQRVRAHRAQAGYEIASGAFDFVGSMLLLFIGLGPVALVAGLGIGELVKLAISWTALRQPVVPNFRWRLISRHISYGKWVWGSSVLTVFLNQIDKVLVGRLLGAHELGMYQTAAKMAQMLVADPALALGQYLFPRFAAVHRNSPNRAVEELLRVSRHAARVFVPAVIVLMLISPLLVRLALGSLWEGATPLLRVFLVVMLFTATVVVLVAYVRAIGHPHVVLVACVVQMTALIAGMYLARRLGTVGTASAMGVALALSAFTYIVFLWRLYKPLR